VTIRRIIFLVIIAFGIFFVGALIYSRHLGLLNEKERGACLARGGRWITGPVMSGDRYAYQYCHYPAVDEGKDCIVDTQCSDVCAVSYPVQKNSEGYIMGKCTLYNMDVCPRTLPKKVTSEEELNNMSSGRPCA
jgi:hypothetical protein